MKNMISFTKTIVFRLWLICIITLTLPLCSTIFFLGVQHYNQTCSQASKTLLENSYMKTQLILNLLDLNKTFIQLLVPSLNLQNIKTNTEKKDLSLKLKKLFTHEFHEISIVHTNKEGEQSLILSTNIEQTGGIDNLTIDPLSHCSQKISIKTELSPSLSIETCINFPQKDQSIISAYTFYKPNSILSLIVQTQSDKIPVNTALITPQGDLIEVNKHNGFIQEEQLQENTKSCTLPKIFLDNASSLEKILTQKFSTKAISSTLNGKTVWGYKTLIPNTNISLVSYANKDQILQPVKNKLFVCGVYMTFIIFSSFISLFISRKFSKPIQQLDDVMTKLQHGHSDTRYQPDIYGFEINKLGIIFNHMIDQLLKQQYIIEEEFIKKEVLTKELSLGEQAQDILLSTITPYYPTIKISKVYIPATIVSGDFYDIFKKSLSQNEEDLFLIVADASGKGVSGCCYSLILKNLLATYLKERKSLEEAIFYTNEMFQKDTRESGMFVTAAIVKYNYHKKSLLYYSCGHPPICIINKDGSPHFIHHPGIAFGFTPIDKTIKSLEIPISPGDVIVMYSDGVIEAHDENYVLFGENRLKNALSLVHHLSTFDISHFVIHKINHFVKNHEQYDDITILVIKVEEYV